MTKKHAILLFHHATKGRRFKLRVDREYERCFFDSLKSKTRKASAPPSRHDMAQLKWEKRERRAEKKERNVCRKDLALRCVGKELRSLQVSRGHPSLCLAISRLRTSRTVPNVEHFRCKISFHLSKQTDTTRLNNTLPRLSELPPWSACARV